MQLAEHSEAQGQKPLLDDGEEDGTQQTNGAFVTKNRKYILGSLFVMYVSVSIGMPSFRARDASCSNGFFWEDHLPFAVVFLVTKVVELWMYSTDLSIPGELGCWSFLSKFAPSLLGYADGYTDAVSVTIAFSCPDPEARRIAWGMLVTYALGVVVLQWGLVALCSLRDPSGACLMQVVHMDALAACVTLPSSVRWIWVIVNVARTIGEDIPQCILQALFIMRVQRNNFMLLSVGLSACSSLKAVHDAVSRGLKAVGFDNKDKQAAFEKKVLRLTASGSIDKLRDLIYKESEDFTLESDFKVCGGISPLALAVACKDREATKILLEAGAVLPDMTTTLPNFEEAWRAKDLPEIVRQIAAGADVNTSLAGGGGVVESRFGTPLHAVCKMHREPGAYEVLVLLLRRRADPAKGDAEGDNALAHAKYFKASDLYALLDANGAKLAGPTYFR